MAKTNPLLREAVEGYCENDTSVILQKTFGSWFDGFVYNQIWEDPVVDRRGLNLGPTSRVLCIASGGCNVLNYLSYGVAKVVAVDLNIAHVKLTRLKLACLQAFPKHDDFFRFFGLGSDWRNINRYYCSVRKHISADDREFWESQPGAFRRPRIEVFQEDFYRCSRSAYFIRLLHWVCRLHGKNLETLLEAKTLSEQVQLFEDVIQPMFRAPLVRLLGRLPLSVFSLGIPPQQFRQLQASGENILAVYENRVRRLACEFPISSNYFAWQAFGLRYNQTISAALPDYLRLENYAELRKAVGRASVHWDLYTRYLSHQQKGAFDSFVLLDAQDWMSRDQLNELWAEIIRVGPKGSRIVFRTAGRESPLVSSLKLPLQASIKYLAELSTELHQADRSAVYGGLHVYEVL